ncbi:MAG: YggT family protein [Gemmataceae bacterium]|nr:YggT family protein [Gemmataceae bacterium]
MNQSVADLFTAVLYILMVAVIVRSLMTWFPVRQDNQFARVLFQVTEPLLEPIRRIMPRMGMIDLSGLVLIILLQVMVAVVQQTAAS